MIDLHTYVNIYIIIYLYILPPYRIEMHRSINYDEYVYSAYSVCQRIYLGAGRRKKKDK